MSETQVLIIGRYEIADENVEAFRAVAIETARAARTIEGCVQYSFANDLENPRLFQLAEIWRDQAALDERLASEAFRETGRKVSGMTVLHRSVTRFVGHDATRL